MSKSVLTLEGAECTDDGELEIDVREQDEPIVVMADERSRYELQYALTRQRIHKGDHEDDE